MLNLISYNIVRIPKLLAATGESAPGNKTPPRDGAENQTSS
jgi:hypothetical protein